MSVALFKGVTKVDYIMNGILGGLVCITAPCAFVNVADALVIGVGGGLVANISNVAFAYARVDDPVGALGVHGICGALGLIFVGLFHNESGLLYTLDGHLLAIQCLAVLAILIFGSLVAVVTHVALHVTVGTRVTTEEELAELDLVEHGIRDQDFLPPTSIATLQTQGKRLPVLSPLGKGGFVIIPVIHAAKLLFRRQRGVPEVTQETYGAEEQVDHPRSAMKRSESNPDGIHRVGWEDNVIVRARQTWWRCSTSPTCQST